MPSVSPVPPPPPVSFPTRPTTTTPVQPSPAPNVPPAAPYMATGMTQSTLPKVFGGGTGYEPYYGGEPTGQGVEYMWGLTGFKHWARSAWAKIFDPKFFLEAGTPDDYSQAAEFEPLIQHNLETKLPWESWIEKLTGITSKEAAQSLAAAQAAVTSEEGKPQPAEALPVITGIGKRAIGQTLWTGLGLFGTLDYISRLSYAIGKTLEEVADMTSKLPGLPHYGDGRDVFLTEASQPGGLIADYNIVRILTGRYDPAQFKETFDRNMRSANFIYTLVQDEAKAHEFARRVAAGETPEFIGQEIQNPWVELAGSVLFDPLTYFGMSIPTSLPKIEKGMTLGEVLFKTPFTKLHIPTFTEALFPKVAAELGPGRIPKFADRVFEFADPALDAPAQRLGKAIDDIDAIKIFTSYSDELEKSVHAGRLPRAFVINSSGRAAAATEDARIVLKTVTNYTKNPNDTLELLKGWHYYLHGTPEQKAVAVATLIHGGPGKLPFSKAGLATGELISRLYDNGEITKIVEKYGDDLPELATRLGEAVEKAASDLYPSVNEMAEAAAAVAKGAKGRQVEELAELYKEVSPQAKIAQWMQNTPVAKTWRASIGAFSNIYMGGSPAYPIKNIAGQAPMIAATLGPAEAARISVESMAGYFPKTARGLLDKIYTRVTDLLGYVPEAATRSMTAAGMEGRGFMKVAQYGENIASAEIILSGATKVVQDALRGGTILGKDEIAVLKAVGYTDEMLAVMMKTLLDSNGKPEKAIEVLRNATNSGFLELCRTVETPKALREFLTQQNFYEAVTELQATAKTEIEFQQGMQELTRALLKKGDLATLIPASADVGIAASEDIAQVAALAADGVISPVTQNRVMAMAQAWENVRLKANLIFTEMAAVLANRTPDIEEVRQGAREIGRIQNTFAETYGLTRGLIDKANALYKAPTRGVSELWKDAVWAQNGKQIWSLAEEFPKIDPTKITRAQFNNFLWTSIFEKRASMWRVNNLLSIEAEQGQLVKMAQGAGTTLNDLVRELFPNSDPLGDIARLKQQALDIDELYTSIAPSVLAAQKFPLGTTLDDLVRNPKLIEQDLPGIRGGVRQLFNGVNKDRRLAGLAEYASYGDVPIAEALESATRRVVAPAAAAGMPPTVGRGIYESADAIKAAMQKHTDNVVSAWGKTVPVSGLSDVQEEALSAWKKLADNRMAVVRGKAAAIGSGLRDFILYSYRKSPMDTATGYFLPYHYWYGRTYARWLETVLHNPTIAANYLKYRKFCEQEHAGLPDWWKYNIPISSIFGIELDHPLFFNLEATINPLNGMTGVDFIDPYKRVDWFSRVVDDAASFGPSLYAPVQWAVALDMSLKGDEDARARWMGRLFPQTTGIKAIGSVLGVGNLEVDPFVNWFSGGLDPHERARVGRMLGTLADERKYTDEQVLDASHSHTGQIWDEAVARAVNERAWGQIGSSLAGIGFKPRTPSDIKIDQFYQEQRNLLAVSPDMSPEDYRRAWDMLRAKYPFGDAVVLAKKGGSDRDTAYAYSVLGRIPPGQMDDLLKMLGIGSDVIDKFYNGKGTFDGWTEGDRLGFMGAMADLGAMLQIPDYATKQQWTTARETYQTMLDLGEQLFGAGIWDSTGHYLNLDARNEKDNFLALNPVVEQALDWRQMYVANNATLYPYYGSIESIQSYYSGLVKDEMIRKFGSDIYDKFDYYGTLKLTDPKTASAYYKAHPELKGYGAYKTTTQDAANRALVQFVNYLPERPNVPLRPAVPQTERQEQIATGAQPQGLPDVWSLMSPPLQRLVMAYWQNGDPLPSAANDQLDYIGDPLGMSGAEVLQVAGLLLGQAQP